MTLCSSSSPLVRAAALTLAVFAVLVVLSRFSMSESATGAHGRKQSQQVCRSALKRAGFYAEASEQDESPVLALLHACEARAQAQAARDLAERTGVRLDADALGLVEEQQDRIDALLLRLQEVA
jgi:poly(3-hydroxybutyrate) depolymerase